jgi:hypothetical protein
VTQEFPLNMMEDEAQDQVLLNGTGDKFLEWYVLFKIKVLVEVVGPSLGLEL